MLAHIVAVEFEELLGASAAIISIAVLISASIKDQKDREVPDTHWAILGVAGMILFFFYSVNLTGFRQEYILLAAGTVMILIDILWEKEFNPFVFYFIMAILFIVPLYGNLSEGIFRAWASIPLCYLIYVGMYVFGVIRGGADVKCLIALSITFPNYPMYFGLPIIGAGDLLFSQIFVSSISILFFAAAMSVPVALYYGLRNAKEGSFSGKMFSGYSLAISEAEKAYVWPLEDIIDGELAPIKIPDEEDIESIYSRLKEAGQERVRVTHMIPFVVPITAATIMVLLIGNPLFLFF